MYDNHAQKQFVITVRIRTPRMSLVKVRALGVLAYLLLKMDKGIISCDATDRLQNCRAKLQCKATG